MTTPFKLSLADGLALASALVMLVAFVALPWLVLPEDVDDPEGAPDAAATTAPESLAVSGVRILSDSELDLPRNTPTLFLVLIPGVAVSAGLLALWHTLAPARGREAPRLILLAGVFGLLYCYGGFVLQNSAALSLTGAGFWVALVANVGLIVQYFVPRSEVAVADPAGALTPAIAPAPAGVRGRLRRAWVPARERLGRVPAMAYLIGMGAAVWLEQLNGQGFASVLGFRRIPRFFGLVDVLEPFSSLDFSGVLAPFFPTGPVEAPLQQSGEAIGNLIRDFFTALTYQGARAPGFFDVLLRVLLYDVVVFVIPTLVIALILHASVNGVLRQLSRRVGILLHIALLYVIITVWGADGGTRELVLVYIGINIMLAVSLNLVNGYMGEFSVGHAAFMAVGAYVSAVFTMWAFAESRVFPESPVLPPELGLPFGFIVALLAGGAAAALAGLLVAFPSFRTRGDYLAIVTLAVNFIVQGVINNMESIGGARGLSGVPLWSNLHWVMITTILSLIIIYNLVNSTFGKGIVAIREDEVAAGLMGVSTRRVKLVTFLVSSFVAGVAGGLFAHQLAYINPGNFGILKSTEALVMVYLGGMGSISGSIIAAVLFTLMVEAMRPLAVLKWVVIPLILILLMLYRPQGLFGFREIKLNLGESREDVARRAAGGRTDAEAEREARDAVAGN